MEYCLIDSPIGELMLAGPGDGVISLLGFPAGKMAKRPEPEWTEARQSFSLAIRQLQEYFSGERFEFELPLQPSATTFQATVLAELQCIPFGEIASYGEIAKRLGKPKASRAVGTANGRNPIPIIIPCHRVIGSNGSLTGFGGGLDTKRWLLDHEQRHKIG